jgi:putative phosphoesterase
VTVSVREVSAGSFVGVISDTHGLLRPEALEALRGAELIIHAGDVGGPEVLEALRRVAPVVAVRGNNDRGEWAEALPEYEATQLGETFIYVLHDLKELDIAPAAAGFRVVVSGHSHQPLAEERRGVLYLNPGSAGPRRFKLPVTVARLTISGGDASAEIINLSV